MVGTGETAGLEGKEGGGYEVMSLGGRGQELEGPGVEENLS